MKIILKENVKGLGDIGSIITVKDGYARNFLLPNRIAIEATPKNIKMFENEKTKIQELAKKNKSQAESLATQLEGQKIIISAKSGEDNKLFGSVTPSDISETLKKQGFEIDKKKIVISVPIKRIGDYEVLIKLHSDISAKVNIQIVSE